MANLLETTTVRDVSVFGDAMTYFDEAAALLNLEPGMRAILAHPSRQITFSIPFQRDDGRPRGLHRLPRTVQFRPRTGQGRDPLPSGRHAR